MSEPIPYESLTRQQTLAEQEDLLTLCAGRELDTREIFAPNAYYGHDQILKRWARLPAERPLRIALPHGVGGIDECGSYGVRELVPVVTWSNEPHLGVERRAGVTARLWPIALPYVYLLRMQAAQPRPARRGTLFFPSHSTTGSTIVADFDEVAARLEHLPDECKPVTACVYWRDVLLGHHEPFLRRGIPVVSAGHGLDPLFLARFHHLCLGFRWAAGNDIGTHLFYAMASGCRYFHVETGEPVWDGPSRDADDPVYADVKRRVVEVSSGSQADQRVFAASYLGERFALSRRGLRRTLRRAEVLDVVGFQVTGGSLLAPAAWRRGLRHVARAVGLRRR